MSGRVSLADRYIDHLRARDSGAAARLALALRAVQPFDADLLAHFAEHGSCAVPTAEGPWQGRMAWLGPLPPEAPEAGQLWFDTVEVAAMLLLPRPPPEPDWHPDAIRRWTPSLAWLALRPVAIWQYAGYLALAGARPSDPARIVGQDDETRPVTRLTAGNAMACAAWMGKQLPAQNIWAAAQQLMPGAIEALWGGCGREWIGYPEPDDDEALAISPATLLDDPDIERDSDEPPPPPERRMLYRYGDWSRNIGFRTAIFAETGLLPAETGPRYRR